MRKLLIGALLAFPLVMVTGCNKDKFSVESGTTLDATVELAEVEYSTGKKMPLTVGVGSGLYHSVYDSPDVVYSITDRGPNIKCVDSEKLIGKKLCEKGKIFPVASFAPSIYKYRITDGKATVKKVITLKDSHGNDITGLANPLVTTNTERAFGNDGNEIPMDPEGLDTEAIVKLKDGTFWLAEEYGPSLVHVAADGKILNRIVPAGLEKDLAKAEYPISGTLPAIFMKRKLNRGAESVAVSPDEQFMYFVMQSPLANPNSKAYKGSNMCRLVKMELASGKVLGEYIYEMDAPGTFIEDNAKKKRKQSDVKLSEMVAIDTDKLIVLERISMTTKFYKVDLTGAEDILGSKWDDMNTSPTLEQMNTPEKAGIKPLAKAIVYNSDKDGALMNKVEGIALMGNGQAVVLNDNDFGIAGAKSEFKVIDFKY